MAHVSAMCLVHTSSPYAKTTYVLSA